MNSHKKSPPESGDSGGLQKICSGLLTFRRSCKGAVLRP